MPISKKTDGWYWGSKGPFASKQKAIQVGQAAHASGFKEESIMDNQLIGTFVSTLLHSATLTHLMHFKTLSYSEHVALAAYYDAIPDLVDGLVESIQGAYEVIIEPYLIINLIILIYILRFIFFFHIKSFKYLSLILRFIFLFHIKLFRHLPLRALCADLPVQFCIYIRVYC